MTFSVIIPTLNRPSSLNECLLSIKKCNLKPDEIIVVDQSDNAETKKVIDKFSNELSINYIKLKIKSSTVSRNIGIKSATKDIIVFSDDDIEYQPDFFDVISKIYDDKSIGLLGSFDELTCHQASKYPSFASYLFDFKEIHFKNKGYVTNSFLGRLPKFKSGNLIKTDWAMGYCFSIRREFAIEGKILFDEKLTGYAYAEDLDYTFRYIKYLKSKGMTAYYSPNLLVKHHVSQEYRIPSEKFYLSYLSNRYYLIFKNKKHKRLFFFYLTNLGLRVLLSFKKDGAIKNYKKATKIFKKSKRSIKKGCFPTFE